MTSEEKALTLRVTQTARGDRIIEFTDTLNRISSIQESSLANERCIWLGVKGNRMYLTQDMVAELLPYLHNFVQTGMLDSEPRQNQQKDA